MMPKCQRWKSSSPEIKGHLTASRSRTPGDEHVYPDCSIQTDGLDLTMLAEMSGNASMTVVENR